MTEVFVIYNKTTGFIDGGTGRVNREKNPDGSKALIDDLLSRGDRDVLYLPNQPLPNPEKQKVEGGKIADLTPDDLVAIEAAKPKTEIELLKDRIAALEG